MSYFWRDLFWGLRSSSLLIQTEFQSDKGKEKGGGGQVAWDFASLSAGNWHFELVHSRLICTDQHLTGVC